MDSAKDYRMAEDQWLAYNILALVLPFLDLPDLLRCSQVCKLWQQVLNDSMFWRTIVIRNYKLNLVRMTEALSDRNTVHLKLMDCQLISNNDKIYTGSNRMHALKILEVSNCSYKLIETLSEENPQLEVIRARIICGSNEMKADVGFISERPHLRELKLYCNRALENFSSFGNLRHLYLLGVNNLDLSDLYNSNLIKTNSTLESLALGECRVLPVQFACFLQTLTALKKLRLDYCTLWSPLIILKGISELRNLVCLELLEVNACESFDKGLSLCTNLRELTIIPNAHRFCMSVNNTRILMGVKQLKRTLKKFTWGFSERYSIFLEKVMEVENCVPMLRPPSRYNRLMNIEDLGRHLRELMEDTYVNIIKPMDVGDVFV